jgi:alkylhydroperoxidase family enzyme
MNAGLDPSWTAALAFTDHFLISPSPLPGALADHIAEHFARLELIELGLGLGLFHGFSKMLMALGFEPDEMDTTILDTPQRVGTNDATPNLADPHVLLLAERLDLASRWSTMAGRLAELDSVPAPIVNAARSRLAELYRVDWAVIAPPTEVDTELLDLAVEIAELFAIDVRAISPEHLSRLKALTNDDGVVQLIMSLAIYDGIYRFAATIPAAA